MPLLVISLSILCQGSCGTVHPDGSWTQEPAVLLLINRFLVLLLIGSLALFVFHVSMAAVQPPRATVHHGWILCQGEDDRFLVQEPSVHHGLTVRAL